MRRIAVCMLLPVVVYIVLLMSGYMTVWFQARSKLVYHRNEIENKIYSINGTIVEIEWYDANTRRFERQFAKRISYYKNGRVLFEMNLLNGVQNGFRTDWWMNGNKKREVEYKDGDIDGVFRVYNKNGEMIGECTWKEGVPVSGVQLGINDETGYYEKEVYFVGKVQEISSGINGLLKE